MKLGEIVSKLQLELHAGGYNQDKEVCSAYVCDLLSNVMSHISNDEVWITIQTHQNIVAVAVLLNIPAIIIPEGFKPDQEAVKKATNEGVAIFTSPLSAYLLSAKIYQLVNNQEAQ